jgi:hypothetical protein
MVELRSTKKCTGIYQMKLLCPYRAGTPIMTHLCAAAFCGPSPAGFLPFDQQTLCLSANADDNLYAFFVGFLLQFAISIF